MVIEDPGMKLVPAFCTVEIPDNVNHSFVSRPLIADTSHQVFDDLITRAEYQSEVDNFQVRIMDSNDADSFSDGSKVPAHATANPFLNKTFDEIESWFLENIRTPRRSGFCHDNFVILDERSVKDGTCILVCTQADPAQQLRSEFDMVLTTALNCDVYGEGFGRGASGPFLRTGTEMTLQGIRLAETGGMYMENGVPMVDEEWREFSRK